MIRIRSESDIDYHLGQWWVIRGLGLGAGIAAMIKIFMKETDDISGVVCLCQLVKTIDISSVEHNRTLMFISNKCVQVNLIKLARQAIQDQVIAYPFHLTLQNVCCDPLKAYCI